MSPRDRTDARRDETRAHRAGRGARPARGRGRRARSRIVERHRYEAKMTRHVSPGVTGAVNADRIGASPSASPVDSRGSSGSASSVAPSTRCTSATSSARPRPGPRSGSTGCSWSSPVTRGRSAARSSRRPADRLALVDAAVDGGRRRRGVGGRGRARGSRRSPPTRSKRCSAPGPRAVPGARRRRGRATCRTWRRLEETRDLATVVVVERAGDGTPSRPAPGWRVERVHDPAPRHLVDGPARPPGRGAPDRRPRPAGGDACHPRDVASTLAASMTEPSRATWLGVDQARIPGRPLPSESADGPASPPGPPPTRRATDIVVLDVGDIISITEVVRDHQRARTRGRCARSSTRSSRR